MDSNEVAQHYVAYGVDVLLKAEDESSLVHYSFLLARLADRAAAEGNSQGAELLHLLASVAQARPDETTTDFGFWPLAMSDGRRITPEELSDEEIDALIVTSEIAADPLFKARLHDMAWISRREFCHCEAAVERYFAAGSMGKGSFTYRVESYSRGIQLARMLGAKHRVFREFRDLLVERTREVAAGGDDSFFLCHMLELVCEFALEPQIRELIPFALDFASARRAASSFHGEEHYLQQAASMQKRVRDQEGERSTNSLLGECFLRRAEALSAQVPPDFQGAAYWMSRGVEQLQRSGADASRLGLMRVRLEELQANALTRMTVITLPPDLQAAAESEHSRNREKVIEVVTGKSLEASLLALAGGIRLLSYSAERQRVLDLAKQTPMQAMMGRQLIDERGKVRASTSGILGSDDDEEIAIRHRAYQHASQWVWPARGDYIAHAADAIWNEHRPSLRRLSFLVLQNPWVVPGYEEIVLRGLHAGLVGDWLLSAHLLVPQIEASLRAVMEKLGAVFSVLEGGVETDRTLGGLLGHSRCAEILGADLQFELQGLLIESTGANLRNDVAHGRLPDAGFYAWPSAVLWWLTLRLCCVPGPGRLAPRASSAT